MSVYAQYRSKIGRVCKGLRCMSVEEDQTESSLICLLGRLLTKNLFD